MVFMLEFEQGTPRIQVALLEPISTIMAYVSGFYRITFTILEPFRAEYYDRNSEPFRQLSQDLAQAVNELYENVSGRQSATVIQIQ
jgi:hypothetical protein